MRRLEHQRLKLGEAARWLPAKNQFCWMDLIEKQLFFCDADGRSIRSVNVDAPGRLGTLIPTDNEDMALLICSAGLAKLDLRNGACTQLMPLEQGREDMLLNDACADNLGRVWVGSCHEAESEPLGVLYCCDLEKREATVVDSGFVVPNGPVVSRDNNRLYFSSSFERKIMVYTIDREACSLRNRHVFAEFADGDGVPDGVALDSEGCLWVAHWEGGCLTRHGSDGTELSRLGIPASLVTSLAFGGPDLRTALVTTASVTLDEAELKADPLAGSTFLVEMDVAGSESCILADHLL